MEHLELPWPSAAGPKRNSPWKRVEQENSGRGTGSCSVSVFLEIQNQFSDGHAIWIRDFCELQVKAPNQHEGLLSTQDRDWWCSDHQCSIFSESTFSHWAADRSYLQFLVLPEKLRSPEPEGMWGFLHLKFEKCCFVICVFLKKKCVFVRNQSLYLYRWGYTIW